MADTDYEIILYRKGTAGSITYTFGDSSLVVAGSRRLTRNENDISTLEFQLSNGSNVAAENFLSSSFAGWSGGVTGALQLGDYVKYSLYPTKAPTTKTQYFYGKIVELQQTQDGQLKVKALDYLKKLDREYTKVFYDGYRDSVAKTATWADGGVVISGVTDADIVPPIAYVALATDDKMETIGGSTQRPSENLVTGAVAQAYMATQNAMIGLTVSLNNPDGLRTGTIKVALQADNGLGTAPSGTDLASDTAYLDGTSTAWNDFDIDFTASGVPVPLVLNKKYWIVFSYVSGTLLGGYVYTVLPTAAYPVSSHLWKSDGTNWATQTNESISMDVHTVNYSEVDIDARTFDDSANTISCLIDTVAPVRTQTFVTPVRGLVSYFYGTLTSQEIADALLALNTGMSSGSSANQTAVSGTFSTLGKKLLESLQELADQYQPSGTWSGYQLAFAHYESGGAHTVKFGKRLTTADSSYVTFSHGFDSATDEEVRIIDWSGLKLRTDLRPSSVVVVGKDSSGDPLCYTVTDKALSGSFESRMEGFANVLKLVDDNLTKMSDVQAMGDGSLAAYATNVWEGQVKVSGVYPDLIDLDTSSASFGSGKVITLNLSMLGIVATKFKVKGVVVEANQTTITISNDDVMVDNAQRYYNAKAQRTEAFLAPVGLVDNAYIAVYVDQAIDYADGTIRLMDNTPSYIPGLSKEFSKHSITALNLNVYHAEFERDDGHSIPPSGVGRIRLVSSVVPYQTQYLLYDGTAPVRDERFDKFKTSRLIVDFLTKIS